MDPLEQEIKDYVTLFNNNIKLITSLRRKIQKTLEEEYTEKRESVNKLIKSTDEDALKLVNQIKKALGDEAEKACKSAKEAAQSLLFLDSFLDLKGMDTKAPEEAIEVQEAVTFLLKDSIEKMNMDKEAWELRQKAMEELGLTEDIENWNSRIEAIKKKKMTEDIENLNLREVDTELIATINIFINNTEAMQLLVKEGFAWQATMIARNSIEILLRIIVQVDHYKSVNYVPAKRAELKIENKPELIKCLQKKAAKNKTDFKGLENEAFNIVEEIVKEIFPNNKRMLFGSFANTLRDWYGELCGFVHPELQLKDRLNREAFFSWANNGRLKTNGRLKDYPGNIILMILMFLCNALAVRLIIELFKNRMKDENYDKNIINVDKAYDDFFEFFKNKENLRLHIPNQNHDQEPEKAIQELLEIKKVGKQNPKEESRKMFS